MKMRRRRSSPTWSSSSASMSRSVAPSCSSISRASSSCLRSSVVLRRSRSIARCFAVAISQAPGLSGTPDSGHRSSAATSASCARSSATPTSPTIRARLAISLADSIRQTASIARWVSGAVTAPNHATFTPRCKPALSAAEGPALNGLPLRAHLRPPALLPFPGPGRGLGLEGRLPVHQANLALTLAHHLEEALGQLDRVFLRLRLDDGIAGDQLLGLGEGSIHDGELSIGDRDPHALRARLKPVGRDQRPGPRHLLDQAPHVGHLLLGRG